MDRAIRVIGQLMMNRWLSAATFCFCLLLIVGVAVAEEPGHGYITGRVAPTSGQGPSGWSVSFFDAKAGPSPYTLEYWRVSEYRTRTGDDGSFSKQLPEGTYYIVVLKRRAENKSGNLAEGDLIFPPGNRREQKQYVVRAGETMDIGVISGAVPFKKEWAAQGKTGIEGTVLDKQGNPVEGAMVDAHQTPGKEIPLFVSDKRTGKDGKYLVRVPEGGLYYLIVSGYRNPAAITVETGKMTTGIDVKLPEIP